MGRKTTPINKKYEPLSIAGGGWQFPSLGTDIPAASQDTALLYGFRWSESVKEKEYFFWRIADKWWNNDPEHHRFARHKWSERMIRAFCTHKYPAIGGAASSGKSYVAAGYAVVEWMAAPDSTMVLITSTSLTGARGRAWGALLLLLDGVPDPPCKIRDAIGSVAFINDKGKMFADRGIRIIAADKSKSKHQIGKMIGLKAPNLILIADEHSDISEAVQTVAVANYNKNPNFKMISMSNPSSRFDPFGIFCTPKRGWDSVNVENDMTWETKVGGVFFRFDAMDSPNFELEQGEDLFEYLPSKRTIEETLSSISDKREEALKSREFLRMDRAIFFDAEDDETVYTLAELARAGAMQEDQVKEGTLVAGLDPSFSSGGDGTILSIGRIGYDRHGQHALELVEQIKIVVDMTDKTTPITIKIADKVKAECQRRKIPASNLAVDATGAGAAFCDMFQLQWEAGFMRVQFGGSASLKKVKGFPGVTAKDRYHNRATELFFLGKQYLLGRQLYGLKQDLVKQLAARAFRSRRGSKGVVMQVEPKPEYRARIGSSPDEADSFFVMLECARSRMGFVPEDPVEQLKEGDDISFTKRRRQRTLMDFDAYQLGHDGHLDIS